MSIVFIIFGIIILACIGLTAYTVFWLLKTIDKMSTLIKADNLQEVTETNTNIDPKEIEDDIYQSVYWLDEQTAKWISMNMDFTK